MHSQLAANSFSDEHRLIQFQPGMSQAGLLYICSAAAPAAEEWVEAARARASADQTLELLRAHAAALTASLA